MSKNKDEEYSYDDFLEDSSDDYPKYGDLLGIFGKMAKEMKDPEPEKTKQKSVWSFTDAPQKLLENKNEK